MWVSNSTAIATVLLTLAAADVAAEPHDLRGQVPVIGAVAISVAQLSSPAAPKTPDRAARRHH